MERKRDGFVPLGDVVDGLSLPGWSRPNSPWCRAPGAAPLHHAAAGQSARRGERGRRRSRLHGAAARALLPAAHESGGCGATASVRPAQRAVRLGDDCGRTRRTMNARVLPPLRTDPASRTGTALPAGINTDGSDPPGGGGGSDTVPDTWADTAPFAEPRQRQKSGGRSRPLRFGWSVTSRPEHDENHIQTQGKHGYGCLTPTRRFS